MAYGFFFMASYPIVEAGVMHAVHDSVRGRAFGLWITIGGFIGSLAHWLVGHWVEGFGPRASQPETYYPLYAGLALILVLSLAGLPCLERVQRLEHAPTDTTEPARANPADSSLAPRASE
jgi:MFS family permease